MPSPSESREALVLVTDEAAATAGALASQVGGSAIQQRAQLLEAVPAVITYYSQGSAALAADFYDEQRELAGETSRFRTELVLVDDTVRIRRAVAWAAAPLVAGVDDAEAIVSSRLAEVIRLDVPRPFRDTVLGNRRRDPAAVGWIRVASGNGCGFCRLLASRGAVYKQDTARFAAHPSCTCTASPVFGANDFGPEASALQYMASRRSRTPAQRAALRDAVEAFEMG